MRFIDLHTHSTASDGSMSPAELVRHAKHAGLAAVALTDHDTVSGIAEALEEGRNSGIEVIPGVEISVDFKPEMHMLGYFFDDSYLNTADMLASLRENREERNPKIIRKLNEMGFDITLQDAAGKARGTVVGRPHIAMAMMEKGYVKSIQEAFHKYLASGKPAYYRKDKLTPEEGVKYILKCGGVPVLAHPVHLRISIRQLYKVAEELKNAGLAGIEAVYVDNTAEDTDIMTTLAKRLGLLITGGSDFHGTIKPDIDIGAGRGNLRVGYEILDKLRDYSRNLINSST